jgi:hypothetical protein
VALTPPVSFGLLDGLDWLGVDLLTVGEGGVEGSSTSAVGDRDR